MSHPRIVIGLPVYNGENYLKKAIESILSQSFGDFQLFIGDNASTDATEFICLEYARQDSRIKYHRHVENIGAAPNFNFLFQPKNAPYFKWAAHDDILEPDYLRQCIELLDRDSSIVIAHSPAFEIDRNDRKVRTYDAINLSLNAERPRDRFWRLLWTEHFTEVFGVVRSEIVAKTKLHGSYVGSDRNFLAEILLQGNMGYAAERLFCRREHPESYVAALRDNAERRKWFDPKANYPDRMTGLIKAREYSQAILSAPISPAEKIACQKMLIEFVIIRSREVIFRKGNLYRDKIFNQDKLSATSEPNLRS
jgi:glycosyltransferase involved in cell wall biosynthesis